MEEHCGADFQVAIPVRVQGMSVQNRFFDEKTEATLVGREIVVTRLSQLVDLECELHLTSLKANIAGTFRVFWVDTRETNGRYAVGLELLASDGDLWQLTLPAPQAETHPTVAQAWLGCRRCHQEVLTPITEAASEFVHEGFLVSRHCDHCKATTSWEFLPSDEEDSASGASHAAAGPARRRTGRARKPGEDLRRKGRAPLILPIKVTRERYAFTAPEVCQTINVSRYGVYFLSRKHYDVGEPVQVVMPYKEGDLAIPMRARVVREDQCKDSDCHAVAIHLEERN
jgi:hypothetical protein